MATKFFMYLLLLLPLALHLVAVTAQKPTVHIVTITFPITVSITGGGQMETTKVLPGQEYQIDVINPSAAIAAKVNDNGAKSASFNVFDPARDKGVGNIYWKTTIKGFYISYDLLNWKLVVSW